MRLFALLLFPLFIQCDDSRPGEPSETAIGDTVAALAGIEYPYPEKDYDLVMDGDTIFGTLTMPEVEAPFPAVLIIAGSGPTDRDGNSTILQGKNDAYRMLAHMLAENGFASVRYDKRGIGKSSGAAKNESDLRFNTYVDDATGWLEKMENDSQLGKLAVLGHSEGSLIGMLAVQQQPVSAYISATGAARPADELILSQLAAQSQDLADTAKIVIDQLKRGDTVARVNPMLITLFRGSVQPYLRSWFKYDPRREIKNLGMPVLIVQGTHDIQVDEEEAAMLAKARPGAELAIIDSMNHVFKEAPADRPANMKAYVDPDLPLAPGLEEVLIRFLENALK